MPPRKPGKDLDDASFPLPRSKNVAAKVPLILPQILRYGGVLEDVKDVVIRGYAVPAEAIDSGDARPRIGSAARGAFQVAETMNARPSIFPPEP